MMRLYGRTSAELRQMYMDWYYLPICRLLFAQEPTIRSVVLSFALVDDRPARVEDWILPMTEEDPLWPPIDAAGDEWGLEADMLERAERALFAGSSWPNLGDHGMVVGFASCCIDVDDPRSSTPQFSPWAISRRASDHESPLPPPPGALYTDALYADTIHTDIVGAVRTAWWEDNFNVGRPRFRSSSLSSDTVPLRGVSREALVATPNARFSHDYTREMAEKLIQMLRSGDIDRDELERVREWVEQSRQWQRHLRTHR